MSEELEKFVSENREAFDDKMPPARVWNGIDAALTGKKKKKNLSPIIKWSVAAAAMFTISLLVYTNVGSKKEITGPSVDQTDNMPVTPEVRAFSKLIVLKQEELKKLSKEQPELYNKFTKDITQLDSSYKALKDQLNSTPNKEMLVEAMIQNLQLQLDVLNQQLNIIKEIKQSKKYSHEKNFPTI